MRFAGRVALVTGAASGIGRAAATRLRAEGACLAAADITELAEKAAADWLPLHLDVSIESDWADAIAATEARYGRLDYLINNAGVPSISPIVEASLAEWRRVLSINLDGVFLGIRAAIPAMTRAGGGAIVNVSSILGLVGAENTAAYCASKGGVLQLTKASALEMAALRNGIRVNSAHPGYIETPMLKAHFDNAPSERAALEQSTPIGRLGAEEEIAAAIAYLVSDDASYVTGTSLTVDGGFVAR